MTSQLVSQNLYYYIDPETKFYSYRVYFTSTFSKTNDENSDIKFVDVKDIMLTLLKDLGVKDYITSIFAEYKKKSIPKFLQHSSLNDDETYLSLIIFTNSELSNFYKLLNYKTSVSTNYSQIENKEIFYLNYSLTPILIEKSNEMSYDEIVTMIRGPSQAQSIETFVHKQQSKHFGHYVMVSILFLIIIVLVICVCVKAKNFTDDY
jgi:hypothetical protein